MKKILLFSLAFTLFSGTNVKADFPDVPADSVYQQSISALQDLGIVQGYENGQFDQNRIVSRAEFLKIALLTDLKNENKQYPELNLPVFPEDFKVANSCFPDVKTSEWYAPYVCWAKKEGLVSGYPDGNFYPHQTVNVAEAAKILAKTGNADYEGHWANGYFEKMAPHTLPPSILRADQLLNRAETAEMTWRYNLATNEQLESKPSKILTWEGNKFLNLDYIGKIQHYVVGYLYAKDDQNVYGMEYMNGDFKPKILIGADLESFKIHSDQIPFQGDGDEKIYFYMAADDSHLYKMDALVPQSAGGEFKLYDQSFSDVYTFLYGRDKSYAYQIWCYEACNLVTKFENSDADSFKPLDLYFSRDKSNIYYNHAGDKSDYLIYPMQADVKTFEALGNGYAKDLTRVFLRDKVLTFAVGNDFKVFGRNYVATQGKAYYLNYEGEEMQIEGADLPSFESFALDADWIYSESMNYDFAKDKHNIYYTGKVLNGVDVETFHYAESSTPSTDSSGWSDKNKSYSWSELTAMAEV